MLLKEIFTPEYQNVQEAYGIEIDQESNSSQYRNPPEHFETIGFVLKLDSDGLIDDTLLEFIIDYKMTNLPIMIEVPSQLIVEGKVEAKYLLSVANNVDFMLSLLPPGHELVGDSITSEQYSQLIDDFTVELLSKPNFDKSVWPISNFMEYLMIETLLGERSTVIKNFKPENQYIINNFSSILNHQSSDTFKNKIRNRFYEFYEGKENFDIVVNAIFRGVQDKSQEIFTQHVQHYMIEQSQNNT